MASPGGHKAADLRRSLRDDPQEFELDQFLRLLPHAGLEGMLLSAVNGLGFAAGDVGAVTRDENGVERARVAALALTGPAGVLPRHLTARLALEAREGDTRLSDFLDMLCGRFPVLAHEAWLRGDIAAARERDAKASRAPLTALAGMATDGFDKLVDDGAAGLDADGVAYFATLLGGGPRSADGLARLLSARLALPVRVEQFQGGWVTLPEGCRARLGGPVPLGNGPACGERRWEVQSRLSIIVGPAPIGWLRDLTPMGPDAKPGLLEAMHRLTRLYLGSDFDIELRIRVRAADIPDLNDPPPNVPSRLGLDSWLGRPDNVATVEDCRFRWTPSSVGPIDDPSARDSDAQAA